MMKYKKLTAMALSLVLAASCSITVFAANVNGTRSNVGDTAGPDVAYDSVMGTGYVYSDQHPDVTDPEFLIRKYYCYPGEPDSQEVEEEYRRFTESDKKILYNNPYSDSMKEALPLLQQFVRSFDWIHSDENTRLKKAFDTIACGHNGNVYDDNGVWRAQNIDERFLVLRSKRGQCENFAKELVELCKVVGVECVTYQPYSKHLACLVKIGDQWYAVDPTTKTSFQETGTVLCKAVDYDAEFNRYANEWNASEAGQRWDEELELERKAESGEISWTEFWRTKNPGKTDAEIEALLGMTLAEYEELCRNN